MISFSELGIDSAALGQEVDLGHAYLAGAGAIGNGFLWAARYLNFRGRLEIVDDDCVTSGNLNRQMWFGPADVTHPKADRLAAGAQPLVPNLLLVPRRLVPVVQSLNRDHRQNDRAASSEERPLYSGADNQPDDEEERHDEV